MNVFSSKYTMKFGRTTSNIQVYHNHQFSLDEIAEVLYSVFYLYSPYENIIEMIKTSDHIFCAYHRIQRRCVACALISNTDVKGGLYLTLFGVRKSSQHRGLGKQLLTAIIRWAYETRHRFIYLHVHVKNFKAIGLYEKVGFHKEKYLPNHYNHAAKDKTDAFQMILLL